MSEDKVLKLNLFVTNKCDRGCKHCVFTATNKGCDYLQPEQVRKLVLEAKELGFRLEGSISGKGEPLMHKDIVNVVKAFTGLKICREIVFLTSGFLKNADEERAAFQNLIESDFKEILSLNFSFNLYSKSFPERFLASIQEVFGRDDVSFSQMLVTYDCKNYFKTMTELIELLHSVEIFTGMQWEEIFHDESDDPIFKASMQELVSQEINVVKIARLIGLSYSMPSFHRFESKGKKHYLKIGSGHISPVGRAGMFPRRCFPERKFHCRLLLGKHDINSLYLDPRGNVFTSMQLHAGEFTDWHLGNTFARANLSKSYFAGWVTKANANRKRFALGRAAYL
jgi:hypothetical protein